HLGNSTRGFNTGGAATDNHDSNLFTSALRGSIKKPVKAVANIDGLLAGVQRERVLLSTGDSKEVGRDTGANDQVVVAQRPTIIKRNGLLVVVHGLHGAKLNAKIVLTASYCTQEVRNVTRVQGRCSNLVKQWLEGRVRVAIDKG